MDDRDFPRDFNKEFNPGTYSYTSTTGPLIAQPETLPHVQLRGEIEVLIAIATHSGLSSEMRSIAEKYMQDVLLDYFDASENRPSGSN